MGSHIWPLRGTFNADSRAVFCLGYDSGLVSSHWFSLPPPLSFPPPHHPFISIRTDTWSTASPIPQQGRKLHLSTDHVAHFLQQVIQEHWIHQQRKNCSGLVQSSSQPPKFSLFIRSTPTKISLIIVTFPVGYEKCLFANVKMGSHGYRL